MWNVPAAAGAVYKPCSVMEPPAAPSKTDHVTFWFDVPLTIAVNCCVAPCSRSTVSGEAEILIDGGSGGLSFELLPHFGSSSNSRSEIATYASRFIATPHSKSFGPRDLREGTKKGIGPEDATRANFSGVTIDVMA